MTSESHVWKMQTPERFVHGFGVWLRQFESAVVLYDGCNQLKTSNDSQQDDWLQETLPHFFDYLVQQEVELSLCTVTPCCTLSAWTHPHTLMFICISWSSSFMHPVRRDAFFLQVTQRRIQTHTCSVSDLLIDSRPSAQLLTHFLWLIKSLIISHVCWEGLELSLREDPPDRNITKKEL